jgi:hypothetical protein
MEIKIMKLPELKLSEYNNYNTPMCIEEEKKESINSETQTIENLKEQEISLPGFDNYKILFQPVNNITVINKSSGNTLKEANGKYRLTSDEKKVNMVQKSTILEKVRKN